MTDTPLPINDLPALPRDEDGPVFNEPWEAKAFALAVSLSEVGYFTWPEWVTTFSQEIKSAQERGDPDLGETYYQHWLNALEKICTAKGLVGIEERRKRKETWRCAYLNTPHGKPIELSAAFKHARRIEKPSLQPIENESVNSDLHRPNFDETTT
jgi:nitrile hydratase accessory protein